MNAVKSPALEIVHEILEEGKKWRSINELMSKYELTFPFTLEHRKWGPVKLVRLLSPHTDDFRTCCNKTYENVSGRNVVKSIPCTSCINKNLNAAGWGLDHQNWRLACD